MIVRYHYIVVCIILSLCLPFAIAAAPDKAEIDAVIAAIKGGTVGGTEQEDLRKAAEERPLAEKKENLNVVESSIKTDATLEPERDRLMELIGVPTEAQIKALEDAKVCTTPQADELKTLTILTPSISLEQKQEYFKKEKAKLQTTFKITKAQEETLEELIGVPTDTQVKAFADAIGINPEDAKNQLKTNGVIELNLKQKQDYLATGRPALEAMPIFNPGQLETLDQLVGIPTDAQISKLATDLPLIPADADKLKELNKVELNPAQWKKYKKALDGLKLNSAQKATLKEIVTKKPSFVPEKYELPTSVDGQIDSTMSPWTNDNKTPKTWNAHTPNLFATMKPHDNIRFFNHMAGKTFSNPTDPEWLNQNNISNMELFKNYIKGLKSEDFIAGSSNLYFCVFIADAMTALGKSVNQDLIKLSKYLSQECVKTISNKWKDDSKLANFSMLDDEIKKKYGRTIASEVGDYMSKLDADTFSKIISDGSACAEISDTAMTEIIKSSKLVKKLTEGCIYEFKHLSAMNGLDTNVKNIPADALKTPSNAPPSEFIKNMVEAQVVKYATGYPEIPVDVCFDLNALSTKTIPISLKTFIECAKTISITEAEPAFWKKVPQGLFSTLDESSARVIAVLLSSAYANMTSALLEDLLKHPAICANLSEGVFKDKKKLKIGTKCFSEMPGRVQAEAYCSPEVNLDNDALSRLTKEKLNDWRCEEKSGAASFNVSKRTNAPELLKCASTEVPFEEHICAGMSLSELKEATEYQKYLDGNCFQHLESNLKDDSKNIQSRVLMLRPYAEIKKSYPSGNVFWTGMKDADFAVLASSGAFCNDVDAPTFFSIKKEALAGMTSECLLQLSFLPELTASETSQFKPEVFRPLTATVLKGKLFSLLTPEQLGEASANVTDPKESVATLFTSAIIEAISDAHLSKIKGVQWRDAPAEAFKGINTEQKLHAIPPEAMVYWDSKKMAEINTDVLKKLKADQVTKIGLNTQGSDVITLLKKLPLSAEAKKALKDRSSANTIEATIFTSAAILAIALASSYI